MASSSRAPVLIDTDTGIDDAVAIALAARLPELEVVAITTVHGNTDTPRATRNAREVAWRVGLACPVVAGAAAPLTREPTPARETHGDEGLGYVHPSAAPTAEPDRAAGTIVAMAHAHPRMIICAIGPLTNIARALDADPMLVDRLGPVFVMGGALRVRGTQTRWSEFNWWSDPEAAHAVIHAGLDVRLVPLDVTRRIAMPGSAIRALQKESTHDDAARFWADALGFYAEFHTSYESFDGCVVNDALAIALAANPSHATWQERNVSVSLSDDAHRGAIVLDRADGVRVQVAVDVRARDVLRLIEREVFSRWLGGALAEGATAAEQWLANNPLEER
ncbi:MAG: nucleoside hydrolase [Gemmatimonadota bacterium]|nr:nucleoside hydrolase [Gemmatimonadota bacterium]